VPFPPDGIGLYRKNSAVSHLSSGRGGTAELCALEIAVRARKVTKSRLGVSVPRLLSPAGRNVEHELIGGPTCESPIVGNHSRTARL
jgi:hypothetical protein